MKWFFPLPGRPSSRRKAKPIVLEISSLCGHCEMELSSRQANEVAYLLLVNAKREIRPSYQIK